MKTIFEIKSNKRTLAKPSFNWHVPSINKMICEQQLKKRSIPPMAQHSSKKSHTENINTNQPESHKIHQINILHNALINAMTQSLSTKFGGREKVKKEKRDQLN